MAPVRTRRSATLLKRKRSSLSNEGRDVPKKNRYSSKKAAKRPKRRSSSKTLKRKGSSKRAKKAAPKKRVSALKKYGPKNAPEGAPFPLNAPEGAPFPLNAPEGAIYPLAVPEAPPVFQVGGPPLMNKETGATLKFKTNQAKLISQKANDLFALQASKAKAPESTRVAPDPFELKPIFDKKTGGKLQVKRTNSTVEELAQQMQARRAAAGNLAANANFIPAPPEVYTEPQKQFNVVKAPAWKSSGAPFPRRQTSLEKALEDQEAMKAAQPVWKSSGAMFPARPTPEQLAQANAVEAPSSLPTVSNPIKVIQKYPLPTGESLELITQLPPNLVPKYDVICDNPKIRRAMVEAVARKIGDKPINLALVAWMVPCDYIDYLGDLFKIFLMNEIAAPPKPTGFFQGLFGTGSGTPTGVKFVFITAGDMFVKKVKLTALTGTGFLDGRVGHNMDLLENAMREVNAYYQDHKKEIDFNALLARAMLNKATDWSSNGAFGIDIDTKEFVCLHAATNTYAKSTSGAPIDSDDYEIAETDPESLFVLACSEGFGNDGIEINRVLNRYHAPELLKSQILVPMGIQKDDTVEYQGAPLYFNKPEDLTEMLISIKRSISSNKPYNK